MHSPSQFFVNLSRWNNKVLLLCLTLTIFCVLLGSTFLLIGHRGGAGLVLVGLCGIFVIGKAMALRFAREIQQQQGQIRNHE
jgi:hypothetical protein